MTQTYDNLMAAFAGESQARNKYLAFAAKADEDGFPQIARLFRAAAEAERVHAYNHFRAAGEIKTTAENLEAAIGGENYEVTVMYPPFIEESKESGDKKAERSFTYAWEVEKVHEGLFREALAEQGKEEDAFEYYVCPICGHTHKRTAPDKCPVCGAPGSKFIKVA